MQYLTDITGRYSTEGRSILLILKVVFFKDNPNMAYDVLNSMIHTERHHGIKFLVDSMKDLKSRIIAGAKLPKNRKSKLLIGIKRLDTVKQLKLLSLCYRWKAKDPTRRTYEKFCKSINQGRTFVKHSSIPKEYGFKPYEMKIINNFVESAAVRFSPLNAEGAHVLEGGVVKDGPQHIADELYAMTEAGQIFIDHAEFIGSIFGLNDSQLFELIESAERKEKTGKTFVGLISALQKDGALKLRHVANPAKGWQVAISPLVGFYKMIEEQFCPQSANWDQLEGATKASLAAKDGMTLSSFDVISSTDNIPRELFFALMDPVIEQLPKSKKGDLIRNAYEVDKSLCEKGIYLTPFKQRAWYDIGQAMGRWTSKSQLNLTMNRLDSSVGGNEHNSAINGDDIIVWDELVSIKLERVFDELGIPINETKSFIRKRAGEFSGRIIFRDEGILPVYKGRKENARDDPTGPIRQYGKDGLKLIRPPSLRSKVKRVARYLFGRDCGIDEFVKQTKTEIATTAETNFLLQKKPIVESNSTPEGLINQLFVAEEPHLHAAREALAQRFCNSGIVPGSPLYKSLVTEYHFLTERSRRLTKFRRAAVKRFRLRNNRLDTLVDNLNSRAIITSDGHQIHGFGGGIHSQVFERLTKDVPIPIQAHNQREYATSESNRSKKTYFNRLHRKIRRWEDELRRLSFEKAEVKSTGIFSRFIDFIFGK